MIASSVMPQAIIIWSSLSRTELASYVLCSLQSQARNDSLPSYHLLADNVDSTSIGDLFTFIEQKIYTIWRQDMTGPCLVSLLSDLPVDIELTPLQSSGKVRHLGALKVF